MQLSDKYLQTFQWQNNPERLMRIMSSTIKLKTKLVYFLQRIIFHLSSDQVIREILQRVSGIWSSYTWCSLSGFRLESFQASKIVA